MTKNLPGHAEHPDTRCVFCDSKISWQLIDGAELAYADWWGTTACPDETGHQFPHEPINGYNDGFAYEVELADWLAEREDEKYANLSSE